MKCLEAHHWPFETFDKAAILFKDIIEIFEKSNFNDPSRFGEFQEWLSFLDDGWSTNYPLWTACLQLQSNTSG